MMPQNFMKMGVKLVKNVKYWPFLAWRWLRMNCWKLVHLVVIATATLGMGTLMLCIVVNVPALFDYEGLNGYMKYFVWMGGVLVVFGAMMAWWLICEKLWRRMFKYPEAWWEALRGRSMGEEIYGEELMQEVTIDEFWDAKEIAIVITFGPIFLVIVVAMVMDIISTGGGDALMDWLGGVLRNMTQKCMFAAPAILGIELVLNFLGWVVLEIIVWYHNNMGAV